MKDMFRPFLDIFSPRVKRRRKTLWLESALKCAHTAYMSMQILSIVLRNRIISSGICPTHPLHLNPSDCFLRLFEGQSLQQWHLNRRSKWKYSQENCKYSCRTASKDQRANHSFYQWCEECLNVQGQHFQSILLSELKVLHSDCYQPTGILVHQQTLCASQPVIHRSPWGTQSWCFQQR